MFVFTGNRVSLGQLSPDYISQNLGKGSVFWSISNRFILANGWRNENEHGSISLSSDPFFLFETWYSTDITRDQYIQREICLALVNKVSMAGISKRVWMYLGNRSNFGWCSRRTNQQLYQADQLDENFPTDDWSILDTNVTWEPNVPSQTNEAYF